MNIHMLGICGTFMGSLALLAAKLGHRVTGQDRKIYPPMSTQLMSHGIEIVDGYEASSLPSDADIIVVGNVMTRGMPVIEYILERGIDYYSGPEFLEKFILPGKHVMVVSGTHGKTTTTSMLAWILEYAGYEPGFLIGGIPNNFNLSARLGGGQYFVIEGDEYDSAFFDKRSKFIHYSPNTLIINNIEFDHADIFNNLEDILTQFRHLLRIVPSNGLIVYNCEDINITKLMQTGYWTPAVSYGMENGDWTARTIDSLADKLSGKHNKLNALAAIAAASHIGIAVDTAIHALSEFMGVKRRLELKGQASGIKVYSDFAHHPTAINSTLAGLRGSLELGQRIIAVLDLCSNTMRAGIHKDTLSSSLSHADEVFMFHEQDVAWDVQSAWQACHRPGGVYRSQEQLQADITKSLRPDDVIIVMSNGAFDNFATKLVTALTAATATAVD